MLISLDCEIGNLNSIVAANIEPVEIGWLVARCLFRLFRFLLRLFVGFCPFMICQTCNIKGILGGYYTCHKMKFATWLLLFLGEWYYIWIQMKQKRIKLHCSLCTTKLGKQHNTKNLKIFPKNIQKNIYIGYSCIRILNKSFPFSGTKESRREGKRRERITTRVGDQYSCLQPGILLDHGCSRNTTSYKWA